MQFLDGATGLSTSGYQYIRDHASEHKLAVHISGTATVVVRGKAERDGSEFVFTTLTATTEPPLVMTPLPFMEIEVTEYTGGTISAWII